MSVTGDWRNAARAHNYRPNMGDYEPAMTFEEIAAAMGTDRQHVWHWYAQAIRKLRAQPDTLRRLLAMADALAAEREKRLGSVPE